MSVEQRDLEAEYFESRPFIGTLFGWIGDRVNALIFKVSTGEHMSILESDSIGFTSAGRLASTSFWRGTVTLEVKDSQFETFRARNAYYTSLF